MRVLMGLLVSAGVTVGLTPAALDTLHTAESTASTIELQLVARNARLSSIHRGADNVESIDLKRATSFSEYWASDWDNKPTYDTESRRVYALARGEQCQALELVTRTAPDQSFTNTDVEIVTRPLSECERVREPSQL